VKASNNHADAEDNNQHEYDAACAERRSSGPLSKYCRTMRPAIGREVPATDSCSAANSIGFKRDQTEYAVPVRSRLIVSSFESACDAARTGIGIAEASSYHVAESIKSGELVPLLQDFQAPPIPISFVYSPHRFMPVKLRAFLDFALPRLRARLGDLPKNVTPRRRAGRRG
jgi:DNA-binding transcriptional LysR family regulator